MSILRCAGTALTLCLLAIGTANAKQAGKNVVATDLAGNIQLTSCNCGDAGCGCPEASCGMGCCDAACGCPTGDCGCADMACGDICGDSCGSMCGGGGGFGGGGLGLGLFGCQPKQVFVGGEYLYLRSSLSQNVSYLDEDFTSATSPHLSYHQFDPSYSSSYRAYAGVRLCCCGDEIRFTYTRFKTDDIDQSPIATQDRTFVAPLEVLAVTPGSRLNNSTEASVNNYDLGITKTIPLGSPMGNCGDCCNCCPCPAWDLQWTGAVRFANVDHASNFANNLTGTNLAGQERTAALRTSFDGVGLRTGLLGRRYIGRSGIASVFVKGDISLLVGEVDNETVGFSNATPLQTTRHSISCTHVIPVTELEAGGTVCLTKSTTLTAGYFLSAWHDLGAKAEYNFGAGTTTQLNGWDDANILGFDGLFVRAEMGF